MREAQLFECMMPNKEDDEELDTETGPKAAPRRQLTDLILRPDIHTQLNELLNQQDYRDKPTTEFVDSLLNRTYVSPLTVGTCSPPSPAETINNKGPLSMLYHQPYSISPNNIFQSIVITQLNEQIRTRDDIDVQIIKPNELHLIATGKSMASCNKIRSRSSGNLKRLFSINQDYPP